MDQLNRGRSFGRRSDEGHQRRFAARRSRLPCPDEQAFSSSVGMFQKGQRASPGLAYDERGCQLRRPERLNMRPKIKEHTCPKCHGTGFPVVTQPVKPGRKIYPVKCKSCDGKGKITDTD
jgi:DnaJ central domain